MADHGLRSEEVGISCVHRANVKRNFKRNAVKDFFKAIGGVKSVEQLSQLFTVGHASGLERKHLGQIFYNKCFMALELGLQLTAIGLSPHSLRSASVQQPRSTSGHLL